MSIPLEMSVSSPPITSNNNDYNNYSRAILYIIFFLSVALRATLDFGAHTLGRGHQNALQQPLFSLFQHNTCPVQCRVLNV